MLSDEEKRHLKGAVNNLIDSLAVICESGIFDDIARALMEFKLSLIKAGFSPEEAIQIILSWGQQLSRQQTT
jgi:hypothetical protein